LPVVEAVESAIVERPLATTARISQRGALATPATTPACIANGARLRVLRPLRRASRSVRLAFVRETATRSEPDAVIGPPELDPVHRTVMLGTGPALSTDRLIDVVEPLLITDSGRRCLTLAVARALTQRLLVHSHISAKFAVTAEPIGESFNTPRQLRYNAGCVIVIGLDPTATGRTMDIWLNARSAPPLPQGQAAPAPSAYSP
jgi:hypothetical protein